MPIGLRISDLDLPSDVVVEAVDWQVATDEQFSDIVVESMYDRENLTSIVFFTELDPGIDYHARARVFLNPSGYTAWSDIDMFTPRDINDIDATLDLPTRVTLPTLTTDSDAMNHAITMFTLSVSGYSVIGNATLDSVTWVIEDVDGEVIWRSINNKFNLSEITVADLILDSGAVYRVRAIFNSSTGDSSQVATTTISTIDDENLDLISPLVAVVPLADLNLELIPHPDITSIEYELYVIDQGVYELVWSDVKTSGDVFKTTVPGVHITTTTRYMLKIKSNLGVNWSFIPFTTY